MQDLDAAKALMDCGLTDPEEYLAKAQELGFSFSPSEGEVETEEEAEPEDAPEEEGEDEPMEAPTSSPDSGGPHIMLVLSGKRKAAASKALKKHGY